MVPKPPNPTAPGRGRPAAHGLNPGRGKCRRLLGASWASPPPPLLVRGRTELDLALACDDPERGRPRASACAHAQKNEGRAGRDGADDRYSFLSPDGPDESFGDFQSPAVRCGTSAAARRHPARLCISKWSITHVSAWAPQSAMLESSAYTPFASARETRAAVTARVLVGDVAAAGATMPGIAVTRRRTALARAVRTRLPGQSSCSASHGAE